MFHNQIITFGYSAKIAFNQVSYLLLQVFIREAGPDLADGLVLLVLGVVAAQKEASVTNKLNPRINTHRDTKRHSFRDWSGINLSRTVLCNLWPLQAPQAIPAQNAPRSDRESDPERPGSRGRSPQKSVSCIITGADVLA